MGTLDVTHHVVQVYIVLHVCILYSACTWRGPIRPKLWSCIWVIKSFCDLVNDNGESMKEIFISVMELLTVFSMRERLFGVWTNTKYRSKCVLGRYVWSSKTERNSWHESCTLVAIYVIYSVASHRYCTRSSKPAITRPIFFQQNLQLLQSWCQCGNSVLTNHFSCSCLETNYVPLYFVKHS